MECSNPFYRKNNHYYHWSRPFDSKGRLIFPAQKLDCRKCIHCRKNRGSDLAFKCVLEETSHQQSHFITLTKKPDYEKEHPKYEKKEIKNFIKRLHRRLQKENRPIPKIYRVHEHGKFGRSHYHIVCFNLILTDLIQSPRPDTFTSALITDTWQNGFATVQTLNHATAMYQSLYLDKDLKNGHANSDRKAVSWHSGIGTTAFLKNYKQWLTLGYIPFGEKKQKIPRTFTRIAQKHLDAFTLTNEQFVAKYMKKTLLTWYYPPYEQKFATIMLQPIKELAELYASYKNQPRDQEKNNERMKQITEWLEKKRKLMPDFHLSGENSLHNQAQRLENDKL